MIGLGATLKILHLYLETDRHCRLTSSICAICASHLGFSQVHDEMGGNQPLSFGVHHQGQTFLGVRPQQGRRVLLSEDHDGDDALPVYGGPRLPVLHPDAPPVGSMPNSRSRLDGSVVKDAPVSTLASMSWACWPSMLEMRSGHVKGPMGMLLNINFCHSILPDSQCPLTGASRFVHDRSMTL